MCSQATVNGSAHLSSMPLATFVWSTLSSVLRRLVDSLCRRLGLCSRPRRLLGGPLLCRWLARPPLRRHHDHLFISSRRERRRCRALCRARRLLSLGRSNVWRRFCIVPSGSGRISSAPTLAGRHMPTTLCAEAAWNGHRTHTRPRCSRARLRGSPTTPSDYPLNWLENCRTRHTPHTSIFTAGRHDCHLLYKNAIRHWTRNTSELKVFRPDEV